MDDIYRAIRKEKDINTIEDIRKEIDKIGNLNLLVTNFEKSSSLHKKGFLKENTYKLVKIKLLNSKIKDKQEINEKLKILLYHLSLLKSTPLTKDFNAARRCMSQFTTNDLTKMAVVLKDIDKFKESIEELNKGYNELDYPITLDFKINEEFAYKKLIDTLFHINQKQRKITAAIGKDFVKTAKDLINDENYRDFIRNIT